MRYQVEYLESVEGIFSELGESSLSFQFTAIYERKTERKVADPAVSRFQDCTHLIYPSSQFYYHSAKTDDLSLSPKTYAATLQQAWLHLPYAVYSYHVTSRETVDVTYVPQSSRFSNTQTRKKPDVSEGLVSPIVPEEFGSRCWRQSRWLDGKVGPPLQFSFTCKRGIVGA
ncbi:MAG: hypothetical protein WCS57_04535, partial [Bacillota bacterium]